MPPRKKSGFNLSKMMDYLINKTIYFDPDDPILVVDYQPKHRTKLLIITGSNACGKSFFGRLISSYCMSPKGLNKKIECMRVGMEVRTESSPRRAFMLQGMENEESTGVNSIHLLRGTLTSAQNRDHDNLVIIDEPDIGLSESYRTALGQYLSDFMDEINPLTKLLVVITHSRLVVEQLLGHKPAHLRFEDEMTLEEWLEVGPPEKTVEDLLALPGKSRETWRRINRALEKRPR